MGCFRVRTLEAKRVYFLFEAGWLEIPIREVEQLCFSSMHLVSDDVIIISNDVISAKYILLVFFLEFGYLTSDKPFARGEIVAHTERMTPVTEKKIFKNKIPKKEKFLRKVIVLDIFE